MWKEKKASAFFRFPALEHSWWEVISALVENLLEIVSTCDAVNKQKFCRTIPGPENNVYVSVEKWKPFPSHSNYKLGPSAVRNCSQLGACRTHLYKVHVRDTHVNKH